VETTSRTNRIKTSDLLRTKGALTGNFGRRRVRAGSALADLGVTDRERVGNLPTQDEYLRRLQAALGEAGDARLAGFILSEIRKLQSRKIQQNDRISNPAGPHCDLRSRERLAGR
jgi:hypothetical protein